MDDYVEDESGSFDWSVPDEEVHAFWNEHERHIGTSLYGRGMYETMCVWENDDCWSLALPPGFERVIRQVLVPASDGSGRGSTIIQSS